MCKMRLSVGGEAKVTLHRTKDDIVNAEEETSKR